MRDIHFIALMYSKDRWVKGYYVKKGYHAIESEREKGSVPIRVETLCQFTGIVTKNGTGVYENMILRFVNKIIPYWIVVFKDGCFMLQSKTTVPEFHTFSEWKQTIIEDAIVEGTIFDEDIEKRRNYKPRK